MKKILGLTVVALLVMALVGGGTWAYFSDVEATNVNVLTAGVLDLTRDGSSSVTTAFLTTGVSNASPGDSNTNSTLLANTAGTASGELDINLGNVAEVAGVVGEFAGGTELAANLYVTIWLDKDDAGSWNADDVGLQAAADTEYTYVAGVSANTADSGTTTTLVDAALTEINDYWNGFKITMNDGANSGLVGVVTDFDAASDTLTVTAFPSAIGTDSYDLDGPLYDTMSSYHNLGKYDNVCTIAAPVAAGDDWDFNIEWLIPASVGNTIQGDAAQFDAISFTLEQAAAD